MQHAAWGTLQYFASLHIRLRGSTWSCNKRMANKPKARKILLTVQVNMECRGTHEYLCSEHQNQDLS
jgi:hypothetical protein